MITADLYDKVLIEPARDLAADRLSIVSGYASAAFASEHLSDMLAVPSRPVIKLLLGMFPRIGFLRSNHLAFQQLSVTDYPIGFECRYITSGPSIHTKAYSWYRNQQPLCAFVGSANYSRGGFGGDQGEAVATAKAEEVQAYFDFLWGSALDCREPAADSIVEAALIIGVAPPQQFTLDIGTDTPAGELASLPHVQLSLLARNGQIHNVSGLNWGQRPGREPNQAYLTVPTPIGESDFFPPLRQHFTLMTDDDRSLICVSAQPKEAGGDVPHAIQTPLNNSDLGVYFRRRLGLASGVFVTKQNLLKYGRTSVTIYKLDPETYYMDYSV